MTRYTNFGSFLSRNEFGNLMREIELENNAPNTLVSSSLSLHVEVATEPNGARHAGLSTVAGSDASPPGPRPPRPPATTDSHHEQSQNANESVGLVHAVVA